MHSYTICSYKYGFYMYNFVGAISEASLEMNPYLYTRICGDYSECIGEKYIWGVGNNTMSLLTEEWSLGWSGVFWDPTFLPSL